MTKKESHRAAIYWFTGLSGAGKSTIAEGARQILQNGGYDILILDGDDVRERLHQNLGFSETDIKLNNELIAKLCVDLREDHDIIFVPIISPYNTSRSEARKRLSPGFYEIYLDAGVDVVKGRDVKGLYALADKGAITDLVGYSDGSPYEPPSTPDLVLHTANQPVADSICALCDFVRSRQ